MATSKSITSTIAQQEKEFQKAVQPGSPISALLSSARQPLLMGTAPSGGGGAPVRESPLLRKLQAVKESPLRRAVTRGLDGIAEGQEEAEEGRARRKELEAQKARIVAQMAPVREEGDELEQQQQQQKAVGSGREKVREKERAYVDRENLPPIPMSRVASSVRGKELGGVRLVGREKVNVPVAPGNYISLSARSHSC